MTPPIVLVVEPFHWWIVVILLLHLPVVLGRGRGPKPWPLRRWLAYLEGSTVVAAAVGGVMMNAFFVGVSLWPGDGLDVSDARVAFTLASLPAFGALAFVMMDRMCGEERNPRSAFVLICYLAVFPVCAYAVNWCLTELRGTAAGDRGYALTFAAAFALCFLVALHHLPSLIREVRFRPWDAPVPPAGHLP